MTSSIEMTSSIDSNIFVSDNPDYTPSCPSIDEQTTTLLNTLVDDCDETIVYSLLGIMISVSCSLNVIMMFIAIVVINKRRCQHTYTCE